MLGPFWVVQLTRPPLHGEYATETVRLLVIRVPRVKAGRAGAGAAGKSRGPPQYAAHVG